MPKRKTATPAQTAAAAIARAAQAIPEGTVAVQSTVWIPAEMVELWKGQKPEVRGEGWVKGVKQLERERSEFPWDELEMLREQVRSIKNVLGVNY